MKPIYLKMTAFGSYCDPAEIDFTKLYDNGVFLITGKTGGGKTTILDAMCVALYGKATGSERAKDWKQLRCSCATPALDTEIEFIFAIDDKKYKFYRRWHMPKTKSGEIKVNDEEDACYIMNNGETDWTPIATGKASLVNEAAESILKLSQSQFVKVIMLPQGEFRELLIASSDEKEKIFKKLFDTERWEQITERISQKYRQLENELAAYSDRIDTALQAVQCKATSELDVKISECRVQLEQLKSKAMLNAELSAASSEKLKNAENDAAHHDELATQKKALDSLNVQSEIFAQKQSRLSFIRRLRGVESEYRLMLSAETVQLKCSQALTTAETNKRNASESLSKAELGKNALPDMEYSKNELLTLTANYSTLSQSRGEYDLSAHSLKKERSDLKKAGDTLLKLNDSRSEAEKRIDVGEKYLEECYSASELLATAREHCNALRLSFDRTFEYENKTNELSKFNETLSRKQREYAQRRQKLDTLIGIEKTVENKLQCDKAYSLTEGLTEGLPCPVCGSTHHPALARPLNDTPKSDELELCRSNTEQARNDLDTLGREISSLNANVDSISKRLSELISINGGKFIKVSVDIKSELDVEEKKTAELQKKVSKTPAAKEKLRQLKESLEANLRDIEATNALINSLNISISTVEQKMKGSTDRLRAYGFEDFDALDKKLSEAKKDLKSIESKINAVNTTFSEATAKHEGASAALDAAKQNMKNAEAELEIRQTEFKSKCNTAGIPEDTDITSNLLSVEEENTLEGEIAEHDRNIAITKKRIDDLCTILNGRERPNIDIIRSENEALLKLGKEISESIGQCSAKHKVLSDTAEMISDISKLMEAKANQYSTAQRLYKFCGGANETKTPLHQYVIGIKMDEVIMSANIYLSRLTKGQYALIKKQGVSGREKHQGLNIEILDSNTGTTRSVATLSGGELFLASLSLAFGLSDVVQSFAGGIHLDSLFIDEGFGSLDSETLDTAMDAITSIRENKLLGIISHVSELKERIPCGIEVVKAPNGSALRMRT